MTTESVGMINRIDITKFGCFSDFDWKTALKEGQTIHDFKRLNILYGRNYSGKTTLSRIFRCYEIGSLPENFKNPEFKVTSKEGTFNQADINSHTLAIRVYNRDFIDNNLSFLNDHIGGEIKTFAIVGEKNKETEQQIDQKVTILGSVESKSGLRYELELEKEDYRRKKSKANRADQAIEEKLRRHANDVIKRDQVFGHPDYNITKIKKDITEITKGVFSILDGTEVRTKHDLLREESLPDIEETISFDPVFTTILDGAKNILSKNIKPSDPIQDLLNDALLQSWVRTGMEYHREERATCGFCGQPLPADLWEKLDAHFDKESSKLEEELNRQIKAIETEIEAVSRICLPEKESFYVFERSSFESKRTDFRKSLNTYQTELEKILRQLRDRKKDIFKAKSSDDVTDVSEELQCNIEALNELIEKHNEARDSLSERQQEARTALRQDAVAKFIRDADLSSEEQKMIGLQHDTQLSKKQAEQLNENVREIEQGVEILRAELQDEKKGAEKVNDYLNHYLGHEGLRLEAIDDPEESKFKFQIMRGTEYAYNMSEGERSLVAFCYFIARLEDIETKGKDLIIYIDDPVSSLDSNHIFFVFSLIESVIAKPKTNADGSKNYQYKQLFVSTHNLDFFKYLRRLPVPDNHQGGTEFSLVEKQGAESTIRLMPKYLKDYQTEFHYLFHQIYRCKDGQGAHETPDVFYNFGNNLRKFLEAYLFYKYPYKDDKDKTTDRLRKFFEDDATAVALTNRISNELSHLEGIFDRSMRPIEIPEIPTVANFVLDKMYEKDKEQFNALLQSIGEPAKAT